MHVPARRLTALLSFSIAIAGCGSGGSSHGSGGSEDSGKPDSRADATSPTDSGTGTDSAQAPDSTVDSGEDSGTGDSAPPGDSGVPDSEVADSAAADSQAADSGVPDAEIESGTLDGSVADTGSTGDSGTGTAPEAGPDGSDGAVPGDGGGGVDVTTPTYVVGGSVTGLATGASVVLVDNGSDSVTVSANGTFTFPTQLKTGQMYAATVKTNPTNQTCTVTMGTGSGTVAASAISTIAVTCANTSYTVGGTLTGLASGATVVLQDNLGDNLSLMQNGTFTFTTPVATSGAFSVTVLTQPSTPVQNCTVTGGSGTVGAGNVTSVTVNCASSTFTVGGSVSGLPSGDSLALLDNGGNSIFVSSNGTFAFPTPLASGAMYAVTVGGNPTTPAAATCVVTNGTGTVGSANVMSVTVACTVQYTVGGTVTGLPSGGLVVLSNKGTTYNVMGSSTSQSFTFPTAQMPGTSYAVTVMTPPTGQTCYVANGSGAVTGNVTNIIIRCRTGLVAYYPFDEGSGTTITDVTGGGNNGTTTGTYGTGVSGTALQFNGAQGCTVVGNANFTWGAANAGYTVDYWLNVTSSQSNWTSIFHKTDTGASDNFPRSPAQWFWPGTTTLHMPMSDSANNNDYPPQGSSPTLATATWTHVAIVHDPSVGANGSEVVYVNGAAVLTYNLAGGSTGQPGILWLAQDPASFGYDSLIGAMDEVRIYNVALTQAQVQLDMQ